MSSSNHSSNGASGLITLKSFTELASVLDLDSLPPGPADSHSAGTRWTPVWRDQADGHDAR